MVEVITSNPMGAGCCGLDSGLGQAFVGFTNAGLESGCLECDLHSPWIQGLNSIVKGSFFYIQEEGKLMNYHLFKSFAVVKGTVHLQKQSYFKMYLKDPRAIREFTCTKSQITFYISFSSSGWIL